MEITFLTLDEVLAIHADMIHRYGGSMGIRDAGLLQSAVAMPQASFGGEFLHGDLFEMAAAYLYHLVQNHPFVDGNKRVGAASAVVFLIMNGVEPTASEDALEQMVLSVATGQLGKTRIAGFFRENSSTSD